MQKKWPGALLARLADFLRFAWVSYGIAARHGTPPPERLAAPSKRPALERVLSDALGGAAGGVVLVHWGPYGSGKTFAARRAAERLRANGSLVVALNGHHMLWAERASLQAFVRAGVGIPPDRPEPLSAFFGLRPTTLIVDDMDVPLRHAEDRAECLRALVADSRETRRFNVLLLVTSWEWAAELRALGATLTAEELRGLLGTASDDAIVAAAAVAGTPGALVFFAETGRPCAAHARRIAEEWRRGIEALLLPAEGRTQAPSRFPDRDGVFHWEDAPP